MSGMPSLNELQLDAMKEIHHIGIEGAATALSRMLNSKIMVSLSSMDVMPLVDIPDMVAPPSPVKSLYVGFEGDISGGMITMIREEDALSLASEMSGEANSGDFTEMGRSAFLETGNMLTGNYLSSMANFFTKSFLPTVPRIVNNIQAELVPFVTESNKTGVEDVMLITSELEVEGKGIKGVCLVILTSDAVNVLVQELEARLTAGDVIKGGDVMADIQLSDMEKDTLAEIGNVGTNAAATALAQLAGGGLTFEVPRANVCSLTEVVNMMGGPEESVVALFLPVKGTFESDALLMFSKESSLLLADLAQGKEPGSTIELEEMDKSTLMEVGQIMCGAYMSVVAKFINLELVHGNPHFAEDMAATVMEFAITRVSERYEQALVIDASVQAKNGAVEFKSVFLMLLPPKALRQMLENAKKALGA